MISGVASLFLCLSSMISYGGTLGQIGLALQTGDARELAKSFADNVEITIIDDEQNYSKAQAELVIRDFFAKNVPSSFALMHKGNSTKDAHSQYGIGVLVTSTGTFRTLIYIKLKGANYYIQEIRFEKE